MKSTVTYQGQLKPRFAQINSILSGSARIIIVFTNTVSDYGQFLPCLTRKIGREEMTTLVTHPQVRGSSFIWVRGTQRTHMPFR